MTARAACASAALAATLAAASGCANLEWHKPDVRPTTLVEDLGDCRREARLAASRLAMASRRSLPIDITSATGAGSTVIMPAPLPARDPVEEQSVLNDCMHEKGYRLIAAR